MELRIKEAQRLAKLVINSTLHDLHKELVIAALLAPEANLTLADYKRLQILEAAQVDMIAERTDA